MTVEKAPTQNAFSGVPKVVGSSVSNTSAPAYTVTDTFVKTYAISDTVESTQRVRPSNRFSKNSGMVNTSAR
jgi:hypothetical protein